MISKSLAAHCFIVTLWVGCADPFVCAQGPNGPLHWLLDGRDGGPVTDLDLGAAPWGLPFDVEIGLLNVDCDSQDVLPTVWLSDGINLGLAPGGRHLIPGESTHWVLHLEGKDLGPFSGTVQVGGSADPLANLLLSGDVVAAPGARFDIQPTIIDLGDTVLGACPLEANVVLRSMGVEDAAVESVEFVGSAGWTLSGPLPPPLPTGTIATVTALWSPMDVGTTTTNLRIHSNDAVQPTQFIALNGVTHTNEIHVLEEEQAGAGLLDVLVFVDRSASMGDDQLAVETLLDRMPSAALVPDHDARITLLPIDPTDLDALTALTWIDAADPSAPIDLQTAMEGVPASTNPPLGVEGVLRLLPRLLPGGDLAKADRRRAGLRVMLVSDATDRSTTVDWIGHPMWTVDEYEAALSVLVPPEALVLFAWACLPGDPATDLGALLGGGAVGSCLDAAFPTAGDAMSARPHRARAFLLEAAIDSEGARVTVDDLPWTGAFTLLQDPPAIVFEEGAVPPAGSTVRVFGRKIVPCEE